MKSDDLTNGLCLSMPLWLAQTVPKVLNDASCRYTQITELAKLVR